MPLSDATDAGRYRSEPEAVRVHPDVLIPLSDGTELAARIWRPVSADHTPAPAVLEYIPYRRGDVTAHRDHTIHAEFARAGYVSVRVDLRGAGDSTGIMTDEYSETELADGLEVLSWIAAQHWCDGQVGIIGKSWGGFNGLQIAALQPPELSAVISICSTDDRYGGDVHYNGGAIVADQMLSWAATMWAYNARPSDPSMAGEQWREDWIRRIDSAPVNIETWLGHQRRNDYWKHGSVVEDLSAIKVPVLAVGGLLDQYRSTPFRLLAHADTVVHALVGPWTHHYPHQGVPGPATDFIAESIRWWDHWMAGIDNGVDAEPRLRVWMPDAAPVGTDHEHRPGRWIAEQEWPSPRVRDVALDGTEAVRAGPRGMRSTEQIGYAAGRWLQFGEPAGHALDQRADDARSRTFDWRVNEPVEVLGIPRVRLRAKSDQDTGVLAIRLCDVAPDGTSRLVTMTLCNLTHHSSHEHPEPLVPGEPVEIDVPLLAIAHRFEPGHWIRLSISSSFWPLMWPTKEHTTIRLDGHPELTIPTRDLGPGSPRDVWEQPELEPPPEPPGTPIDAGAAPMERILAHDLVRGTVELRSKREIWQTDLSDGLYYQAVEEDVYERDINDTSSPRVECLRLIRYRRPAPPGAAVREAADWDIELQTRSTMFGDSFKFTVTNELAAYENGRRIHTRRTSADIPRDLV